MYDQSGSLEVVGLVVVCHVRGHSMPSDVCRRSVRVPCKYPHHPTEDALRVGRSQSEVSNNLSNFYKCFKQGIRLGLF